MATRGALFLTANGTSKPQENPVSVLRRGGVFLSLKVLITLPFNLAHMCEMLTPVCLRDLDSLESYLHRSRIQQRYEEGRGDGEGNSYCLGGEG